METEDSKNILSGCTVGTEGLQEKPGKPSKKNGWTSLDKI